MIPLSLVVHASHEDLGAAVARRAADQISRAIEQRGAARVMLAAAPSQLPALQALAKLPIDFSKVAFFHMDDYLGLDHDAAQAFGTWLQGEFLDQLPGTPTFHRIDTSLEPEPAAAQYAQAMGDATFDVTLCGLGVNAHLAFNDPPADFEDQAPVRVVELDSVSRRQQVDEGHFPDMDSVPTHALTVTIPRLLNADLVLCSVLGSQKATAVARTLEQDPNPDVPGTALKLHDNVELHVDQEAMGHE